MNVFYWIYLSLSSLLTICFIPLILLFVCLTGRYKQLVFQRLGIYNRKLTRTQKNRIWLHAVSVGEVNAARAIIDALFEMDSGLDIVLSTTTPKGYEIAQQLVGPRIQCIYSPIDFFVSIRLAFYEIHPTVLVLLETEIWPNWIFTASALNVPVVIINGRISERTIAGFKKFNSLVRFIVQKVSAFSMIAETDAKRIRKIGALPENVYISGNAKFDLLANIYCPKLPDQLRKKLNIQSNTFVLVAGSTRTGEEEKVLEAFRNIIKEFPDALCFIAPRHIERSCSVEYEIKQNGFTVDRLSFCKKNGQRSASVVLIDTIGDLAGLYSIASVVFCGGSLVPKGGQNVLEPAVWGKPVIYGPFMDDFLWAKELLESKSGGIMVNDSFELSKTVVTFAREPKKAKKTGANARMAVLQKSGAALKHAQIVINALPKK